MGVQLSVGGATLEIPNGFEPMTDREQVSYFGSAGVGNAFIDREKAAVLSVSLNDCELEADGVEQRIAEYQQAYSRMAPGFVMGEMRLKESPLFNVGALTFKSNASERDLLNMVAVGNVAGCELFILFACSLEDSAAFMPKFVHMVDGITVAGEARFREGTQDDPTVA